MSLHFIMGKDEKPPPKYGKKTEPYPTSESSRRRHTRFDERIPINKSTRNLKVDQKIAEQFLGKLTNKEINTLFGTVGGKLGHRSITDSEATDYPTVDSFLYSNSTQGLSIITPNTYTPPSKVLEGNNDIELLKNDFSHVTNSDMRTALNVSNSFGTNSNHVEPIIQQSPSYTVNSTLPQESYATNTTTYATNIENSTNQKNRISQLLQVDGENNLGCSTSWATSLEYRNSTIKPWEKSMCTLYDICDKAGNARGFCDKFLEALRHEVANNNFDLFSNEITKRPALVQNLSRRMNVPPPIEIPVCLENGDEVLCYTFDVKSQLQQFLLMDVWGDLNNLAVSNENPWCHFGDPTLMGEMLNGSWAHNNALDFVAKFISAEEANDCMQVPLILYSDKTGVDKIEKNTLEPIMATSPLLKNSVRENHNNWFYIGLVPNLNQSSGANRRRLKGKVRHRSSHTRDYHSCLRAILRSLCQVQQEKPVLQHRRGDIIQCRITSFPIACVIGDNLFHNSLDGRIGNASKSSVRLSRRCLTPFHQASLVPHACLPVDNYVVRRLSMAALGCEYRQPHVVYKVQSGDVRNEQSGAKVGTNLESWNTFLMSASNSTQYRIKMQRLKKIRSKLCDRILQKVLGYHAVDNVIHDLDIGKRENGYNDIMPADILHSIQSGIIPRVLEASILVLSDGVKSSIDEFVNTVFISKLNRSSQRCLFPRTNFNKGFCNLSLLSAECKTGQLFTLAIIIHMWRGRTLIATRFSKQFDSNRRFYQEKFKKKKCYL